MRRMPDRSRPFSSRELLRVIAGFVGLTLLLTYPQIRLMSSHMAEHYDTLFSVWRLAWIAHQLPLDPSHLFDANIFYPERHTLAYSDALLLPAALGAPLIWLGVNEVVVHNLLVLFSFAACGVSMYVLCRELTGSAAAAWFGGVVFAFQPYRFGHYAQLELLWGWPIPLAFWALDRVFRTRRVRDGIWLGVFVAAQALSCLYYAVFLITALTILALVLLARSRWGRDGRRASSRCGRRRGRRGVDRPVCAAPRLGGRTVGVRSEEEVLQWSPTLESFVAALPQNWRTAARWVIARRSRASCFRPRRRGAWRLSARGRLSIVVVLRTLLLLVVAVDLSLGSHGLPYGMLYRTVWVYRGLRVPSRMFVVVSAALAVLGAEGVRRLLARMRSPVVGVAAGLALVGLVLPRERQCPDRVETSPEARCAYAWLKVQPPGVVMEWPTPRASSLYLTHEPRYMYNSTFHWQRLVNGYSGFYPPSFILLVEAMDSFPVAVGDRVSPPVGGAVRDPAQRLRSPAAMLTPETRSASSPELQLVLVERQGADEIAVYRLPD